MVGWDVQVGSHFQFLEFEAHLEELRVPVPQMTTSGWFQRAVIQSFVGSIPAPDVRFFKANPEV